ncbi:hypothetical protein [Nocardia noduli]|uniref:hypothetical protein n=1 Tax=Nocardia noduli TaxID=2815722 RepID=UPI001C24A860|nr:hypothetical protein [Nocardia noduli]
MVIELVGRDDDATESKCGLCIIRPVQSFPASAVQTRFADVLSAVRSDGTIALTYHERPADTVLMIHPDTWHAHRNDYPVSGEKILDPLAISEARGLFGQIRERVVAEDCHLPITRRRREWAIVVPMSWARKAQIVE